MVCTTATRGLVAAVCLITAAGCDPRPVDEPADAGGDAAPDAGECVDLDGDGHGEGCALGPDCDDSDPTVGKVPGCPCADDGLVAACRTVEPVENAEGRSECFLGQRSCQGGVWGECEPTEAYPPQGQEWDDEDDGVSREPILGLPEICRGTCDLGCMQIHDCPAGRDLDADNSVNLVYDPVHHSPPALIMEDPAEEGIFHRVMEASCAGSSLWWAVDYLGDPTHPTETDRGSLTIRARTAPTEAELALLGEGDWVVVVSCPEGPCELPFTPTDRLLGDQGNLFAAFDDPGRAGARFLEYELRMSTDDPDQMPWLATLEVYFICLDE